MDISTRKSASAPSSVDLSLHRQDRNSSQPHSRDGPRDDSTPGPSARPGPQDLETPLGDLGTEGTGSGNTGSSGGSKDDSSWMKIVGGIGTLVFLFLLKHFGFLTQFWKPKRRRGFWGYAHY